MTNKSQLEATLALHATRAAPLIARGAHTWNCDRGVLPSRAEEGAAAATPVTRANEHRADVVERVCGTEHELDRAGTGYCNAGRAYGTPCGFDTASVDLEATNSNGSLAGGSRPLLAGNTTRASSGLTLAVTAKEGLGVLFRLLIAVLIRGMVNPPLGFVSLVRRGKA